MQTKVNISTLAYIRLGVFLTTLVVNVHDCKKQQLNFNYIYTGRKKKSSMCTGSILIDTIACLIN